MKKKINLILIPLMIGACSAIENKIIDKKDNVSNVQKEYPKKENITINPSSFPSEIKSSSIIVKEEEAKKEKIKPKENNEFKNTKIGEVEFNSSNDTFISIVEENKSNNSNQVNGTFLLPSPVATITPAPANCTSYKNINNMGIKYVNTMPVSFTTTINGIYDWYKEGNISFVGNLDYKIRYDEIKKEFYSLNCYDVSKLNELIKEFSIKEIFYNRYKEETVEQLTKIDPYFTGNSEFSVSLRENNISPKIVMQKFLDTKLISKAIYTLSSYDIIKMKQLEKEEEIASASCREKINDFHSFSEVAEEKEVSMKIVFPSEYKIKYDLKRLKLYSIACKMNEVSTIKTLLYELDNNLDGSKGYYNIEGLNEDSSDTESFNTLYFREVIPENMGSRTLILNNIKKFAEKYNLKYEMYDVGFKIKVKKPV